MIKKNGLETHPVSFSLGVLAMLVAAAVIPAGCTPASTSSSQAASPSTAAAGVQLANPAAVFCGEQGGRSEIRTGADGGQVGYCRFPDGSECEEWAFYRGECTAGYTDPFAYCAATGADDTPGRSYVGPATPPSIIDGLKKAAGLSADMPDSMIESGTIWRCMHGHVWACFVGANLPCSEKADTRRTPTKAMADFCRENFAADVIPAAVTGHATVYAWNCVNGAPGIVKQVFQPDEQGFISDFWYRIDPNASRPVIRKK